MQRKLRDAEKQTAEEGQQQRQHMEENVGMLELTPPATPPTPMPPTSPTSSVASSVDLKLVSKHNNRINNSSLCNHNW